MRLLLAEDDVELGSALVSALAQSGYVTDVVRTGREALAAAASASYQLFILDLGLPDMDGLEVMRRMRGDVARSPVLILTARDDLRDRVSGLDAGGDDYLAKPFDMAELEARIRALLRRGDLAGTELRLGAVAFEPASRRVTVGDEELALTARELAVFELLLRNQGRITSKNVIFDSLYSWGDDVSTSTVEVFISRLRRKLTAAGADIGIRVFRGLGYRLEHEGAAQ
jgi:DNA-binding response OmpR family regulator